ncbi:hypothetical protein ACFV1L_15285 [Kitasatospora sp. NPDC059646]|uniref:hypothetical protein n=1 Tax=Kitasatospora sp. NPDC059646 TaxID=3346893 RepID=UPI003699B429
MELEDAAPCRHAGAPPKWAVDAASKLIRDLGREEALIAKYGLTSEEFKAALPAAIESVRGRKSAETSDRTAFLGSVLQELLSQGLVQGLERPKAGSDTVYRLTVAGVGDIAVIQKGCPDGRHSSVSWSAPEWAQETYLWWLCDSMRYEPGEHIAKGVNRLRNRFFGDYPDTVDGVIFHNNLCGTATRVCPKSAHAIDIGGVRVPPPCIYVMPDRTDGATDWNWDGETRRHFPTLLLRAFGIVEEEAGLYVGHVGFQRRGTTEQTVITARYGAQRVTTYRS